VIYALPHQPPHYVWISPARSRKIRSACARIGGTLIPLSAILGLMIALVGRQLPTNFHPFNGGVWSMGAISAFTLLCSAMSLAGARPYVHGGHLDLNGARTTRRVLGALWGATLCTSAFACLILVMTARTSDADNPGFTAGVWGYLGLLLVPPILAGVLFFAGRSLFRQDRYTGP
jgi:hypothetical protein